MILGVVSNCWRVQLRAGMPLEALIDEAERRALRVIELRQTCLGSFESQNDFIPDVAALERLPSRFPETRFNIALVLPFLSPLTQPDNPVFQAGLEAAHAVAGQATPHLRIVDLQTTDTDVRSIGIDEVARGVATLSAEAASRGVLLSVENSIQPWTLFRRVFDGARRDSTANARVRMCYDAANLRIQPERVDPTAVTRSLRAEELAMIHFKQWDRGRFLECVCDGPIDWRSQIAALAQIGPDVPGLIEIESTEDVWNRIEFSRRYLAERGLECE